MKKNLLTLGYIIVTLILAGVAIFIAVRLYQLRSEPVAPTAPESEPAAEAPPTQSCEVLALNLTQAESLSPTTTATATATATASPTPTSTSTSSPTSQPTSTPTPASSQIAQATATPTIPSDVPVTGISLPAILGLGLGVLLILGALALL
ncbi:hypothetical protein A2803_05355 [Candidatus Woesebacteria bacterium RIFCSPHIGHO2_01_FULL_44_21]|uniref:Uncharacterized protein n=1 Tax=Candidatus Woesebacteria bacterium RIFCSPHIGHO2_01_FULL_44_21 TaxID=1802503 RepID=A0A1F7YV63_9BACT|nr:MAG: hypothetical protein A2803_05355 [Candidatus Woesebacteria bacterium RIFCSPHIGHO2_01_FULL_44_21]OGM68793.1 MAG: hypothetical protein A2897_01330 [Candidatus Woesebacteria bacterium RIFCSPLOWO2_01_FULL_44_24b]